MSRTNRIRKKAPLQGVQPVHPIQPPYDPMTPPIQKKKKRGTSDSNIIPIEAYNTIMGQ